MPLRKQPTYRFPKKAVKMALISSMITAVLELDSYFWHLLAAVLSALVGWNQRGHPVDTYCSKHRGNMATCRAFSLSLGEVLRWVCVSSVFLESVCLFQGWKSIDVLQQSYIASGIYTSITIMIQGSRIRATIIWYSNNNNNNYYYYWYCLKTTLMFSYFLQKKEPYIYIYILEII